MISQECKDLLLIAQESEFGIAIECHLEDMRRCIKDFQETKNAENIVDIMCCVSPDKKEIWLCKELMSHLEK